MTSSDSLTCVRRSLHKTFSVPGQSSGAVCGVEIPNMWYPPQPNKWEHMDSFEKMLGSISSNATWTNQGANAGKTETQSHAGTIESAELSYNERKYYEGDSAKDYNSTSGRPKGGLPSYAWLNAFSGIGKTDSMTNTTNFNNRTSRPDSVADLATFLSSTPAGLDIHSHEEKKKTVDDERLRMDHVPQSCEMNMIPGIVRTTQPTLACGEPPPETLLIPQPRSSCAVAQATIDEFTSYRTVKSDAHVRVSNEQDEDDENQIFDPRNPISEEDLKPQPIIRKAQKVHVPDEFKDNKYWKRRVKNNFAARRSREARRMKENQIAMRASFLERENDALKMEVRRLRKELENMMKSTTSFIANQHAPAPYVSAL